jgi:ABC-type multidrug transport system fused ATPase/permease subunit
VSAVLLASVRLQKYSIPLAHGCIYTRSEKFAQGIQGLFQFMFGFAIAFYFEPRLSGVLLACVPVLGLVTTAMFMWGSEDGIFGKEAYESASTIANEAMSNIRTVASLNAEPVVCILLLSRVLNL